MEIVFTHAMQLNVPILIAGDVFDKYNVGNYTLYKVMDLFKRASYNTPIYMTYGQHDLYCHNFLLMDKTAYGILASHGEATHLDKTNAVEVIGTCLIASLGWDEEYSKGVLKNIRKQLKEKKEYCLGKDMKSILMVHKYIHSGKSDIPDLPKDADASVFQQKFEGIFDFIVSGDNHTPFVSSMKGCPTLVNCGGVWNKNFNEKGKERFCYVLYDDGTASPRPINLEHKEHWDAFYDFEKIPEKDKKRIAQFARDYKLSFNEITEITKDNIQQMLFSQVKTMNNDEWSSAHVGFAEELFNKEEE